MEKIRKMDKVKIGDRFEDMDKRQIGRILKVIRFIDDYTIECSIISRARYTKSVRPRFSSKIKIKTILKDSLYMRII